MSIKAITTEHFEEEVLKSEVPVLVDFYADWCGPCKVMMPVVEEAAKEESDAKFFKLDIDKNMEIAKKYRVMMIPTFIVFKGGEVHQRLSNVVSKEKLLSLFE